MNWQLRCSPMPEAGNRHIVLGMAGHIDHGKTALVKALTGTDTDRLKEEKERGMTTDLGFAFFGDTMTIIDVPGHEKFVKTMVAGVNTVDIAMLVIAADDGIMPQTREHLEILRLLQISKGLVVLNKIDIVEQEWLDLITADIRALLKGSFLEHAPLVSVSALTGKGIQNLKRELNTLAGSIQARRDKGIFRLPIDRVFTIKGFGTIVAGTVISGSVHVDDSVELLPQGKTLRVRGLQIHEQNVSESRIGFRTAINLMGIEKESIERGDVIAAPGFFKPTYMIDVQFSYLAGALHALENRTRVRVHIGTSEVIARIILLDREAFEPGAEGFVQIHFEQPIVADAGDRFVVRSYSLLQTIGGGSVLDTHPEKHKRFKEEVQHRLQTIAQGDTEQHILEHLIRLDNALVDGSTLSKNASIPIDTCLLHLQTLVEKQQAIRFGAEQWYAVANLSMLRNRVSEILKKFHREQSLRTGMLVGELHSRIKPPIEKKLFDAVCRALQAEGMVQFIGDRIALAEFSIQLTPEQKELRKRIEKEFAKTPLMPPNPDDLLPGLGKESQHIFQLMIDEGELVRLDEGIVMHREGIEYAKKEITTFLSQKDAAALGEIRQHLGITRKYALPLLLHLDTLGITERDGDVRRLKQR
ncbi:MAG: selenocysteine-specific translation elongation factor [bacterium]